MVCVFFQVFVGFQVLRTAPSQVHSSSKWFVFNYVNKLPAQANTTPKIALAIPNEYEYTNNTIAAISILLLHIFEFSRPSVWP